MPTVQPNSGGATGKSHGNDYFITDSKQATVDSAKLQLTMIHLLLRDNAERTQKILDEFKPQFATKEDYLDYVQKIFSNGDRITYCNEGTATVKL